MNNEDNGYVLKTVDGKGEGVFTIKPFHVGETVMIGIIEKVFDGTTPHSSQIGKNTHVQHAGMISKVNHSCMPNCGIRVNETGGHDFVAMKDINPGEEITFDYAMRNYHVDHFPKQCRCGSAQCRGEITGWKSLPAERKQAYKGFVAPYLLEMDKEIL